MKRTQTLMMPVRPPTAADTSLRAAGRILRFTLRSLAAATLAAALTLAGGPAMAAPRMPAGAFALESGARMSTAGAVPQMSRAAADAATLAVMNRLSPAAPSADGLSPSMALWITPLWQHQQGWDMGDNPGYGWSDSLGGVAIGADYTFDNIRIGAAFSVGGAWTESNGDIAATSNHMTFWCAGLYGGWDQDDFGLAADVAWTGTFSSVEQDLDASPGRGSSLDADMQAGVLSAGLRGEYRVQTGLLDVVPYAGVRFMHINVRGYEAESAGGTRFASDGLRQGIWTFPLGVTLTKHVSLDRDWTMRSSVDVSVMPAAGDVKAREDIRFAGVPAVAGMETQIPDWITWKGSAGVKFARGTNASVGLNDSLQSGQHAATHGLFAAFKYEFQLRRRAPERLARSDLRERMNPLHCIRARLFEDSRPLSSSCCAPRQQAAATNSRCRQPRSFSSCRCTCSQSCTCFEFCTSCMCIFAPLLSVLTEVFSEIQPSLSTASQTAAIVTRPAEPPAGGTAQASGMLLCVSATVPLPGALYCLRSGKRQQPLFHQRADMLSDGVADGTDA